MRRVILKTTQSPGDVVMLTAAVREWKRALGAGVEIDVRTPCPALWENNPQLTPLADGATLALSRAAGPAASALGGHGYEGVKRAVGVALWSGPRAQGG